MRSIRTTIFQAFLLITGISVAVIVSLLWLNSTVTQQYKSTLDLMTTEYRLIDMTSQLASTYKQFAKNTQDAANFQMIKQTEDLINQTLVFLDMQQFDDQSDTLYVGLKNTIESILGDIDQSLTMIDQNKNADFYTSYEASYQEVMQKNVYVKENVSALLISQLQYSNSLRNQIDRFTSLSFWIGIGVLLAMILGNFLFAWRFSRSLVRPLEELTVTAERIVKGDSTLSLHQGLLNQKNEVGRLAEVFATMTKKLLSSINDLNISNTSMLQVKRDIEERNIELQKMNEFMVGRELKMTELKKEIIELRQPHTS